MMAKGVTMSARGIGFIGGLLLLALVYRYWWVLVPIGVMAYVGLQWWTWRNN